MDRAQMEDSQGSFPEMLKEEAGYLHELSRHDYDRTSQDEEEDRLFEAAAYHHNYAQYFQHQRHINYVTEAQPYGEEGPMAVSIERMPLDGQVDELQVLIHSKEGWERDTVSVASVEEWGGEMQALRRKRRSLESVRLTPRIDDGLKERLAKYEQRMISLCHKFGVLYSKEDQTEELQIYNNETASPAFEEFLQFLGKKVELQGFTGYSGGLDTKTNTTGTHSVYTRFGGEMDECEIMFHPLTYLPYSPADPQQIERKRHIGNDVVVVVFREGKNNVPFSSSAIQSQFNHVFVVVSPDEEKSTDTETFYKVAIARKDGIPLFGPPLPRSALIKRDEEGRQWLLMKLISAERAAFRSPTFQKKFVNVRKFQLQYILQDAKLADEKEHTLLLLQQTTKFTRRQLEDMREQLETALSEQREEEGEDGECEEGDEEAEEMRPTRRQATTTTTTTGTSRMMRRDRMTAEEFRQVFAHLCPSWNGRENERAVRRLYEAAKLNGRLDDGLGFVDFVQLLDALAFGSAGRKLGLLRRVLADTAALSEKEGGGVLEVVPGELVDSARRLSFAEFKKAARSDEALVDLFTVEVPEEGVGLVSLVPGDFVASQPDWWTTELASLEGRDDASQSGLPFPLSPAQLATWCVLF